MFPYARAGIAIGSSPSRSVKKISHTVLRDRYVLDHPERPASVRSGARPKFTLKVVKAWKVPKPSCEAILLQHGKLRERRKKPLAHLLVCAKALAAEMGMGVRPTPVDFAAVRDFHYLGLDADDKLESAREVALEKMIQVSRR